MYMNVLHCIVLHCTVIHCTLDAAYHAVCDIQLHLKALQFTTTSIEKLTIYSPKPYSTNVLQYSSVQYRAMHYNVQCSAVL